MAVATAAACMSFLCVVLLNGETLGLLPDQGAVADAKVDNAIYAEDDAGMRQQVDDHPSTVNEGRKNNQKKSAENKADPGRVTKVQNPKLEKAEHNSKASKDASKKDKKLKPESHLTLAEEEDNSNKESWSDDGRVHCVEESADVIRCHSHSDLAEDGPLHVKPDSYRRVDDDMSDAVRKSGGQLEVKKKLSNKENEVDLEENIPPKKGSGDSAAPLPLTSSSNSTATQQRKLVELDHSEGVLKIIDTLTGKKKNVTELDGREDINTDSLMAVNMTPTIKKKLSIVPKFDTLQDSLEYLKAKNFSEIKIDFERELKFELWPNDDICKGLMTRFGLSIPRSLLVSYPRSGSSWLRYLLEAATGIFTGSTSNSSLLYTLGFYGESEAPEQNSTLTISTHSAHPLPGERSDSAEHDEGIPTILLMRSPVDALVSQWHVINSTGSNWYRNSMPPASFETQEFHDFVASELRRWEQTYASRLLWSSNVHVVHYEELKQRPLQELLKVLVFLELPPPSGKSLFCLRNNINGPLRANRSKMNPYTTEEEDALWAAVTRVSGGLRLRGLSLPPHYLPVDRYPPERALRKRRHLRRGSNTSNLGKKDEL